MRGILSYGVLGLVWIGLARSSPIVAGAFVNTGFDNPAVQVPSNPFSIGPADWFIPGWAPNGVGAVGYNYTQNFSGLSSIVDRDFRDTHFGLNAPAPVVGTFSLAVWPPSRPVEGGIYRPYILTQTGDVPADAQSLRFLYHGNDLRVFLGGEERSLHVLPDVESGDPAVPLFHYFSVDVSPYAGETVELRLEFRSRGYSDTSGLPNWFNEPNAQSHVIDDLFFSPLPAVPEPSTWALLGLGSAVFAWGTRRPKPVRR